MWMSIRFLYDSLICGLVEIPVLFNTTKQWVSYQMEQHNACNKRGNIHQGNPNWTKYFFVSAICLKMTILVSCTKNNVFVNNICFYYSTKSHPTTTTKSRFRTSFVFSFTVLLLLIEVNDTWWGKNKHYFPLCEDKTLGLTALLFSLGIEQESCFT